MNTPQLENGFVRIANGILQSLARFKLGSYHYRILFVIFLKTYGFNKKEDWVAISQFSEATDILEPHICRAIKELISMNIITKGGKKVSFQKDARLWKKLPKGVRSHHITKGGNTITKGGNQELPKGVDTIDTLTKDTIQKTIVSKDTMVKDRDQVIDFILDEFKKRFGAYPIDRKPRQVAYNIKQIATTFIKKYGAGYEKYRNVKLDTRSTILRAYDIYQQKESSQNVEYLDTFKRHMKKIFELTVTQMIKDGIIIS